MRMKRSIVFALALLTGVAPALAAKPRPAAYAGRWIKDCGDGYFCRIYIEKASAKRFRFNFMITSPDPGKESCDWTVDMTYNRDDGALWARDPYQNYFFYVLRDSSGALNSSGTMPPLCGQRPLEERFSTDDADEYTDM